MFLALGKICVQRVAGGSIIQRQSVTQISGRPRARRLVRPFLYFRPVPFHIVLSGFSKLSKGRPPSLFSPPNFVVHRVDRQRAVARQTRGGNRNWTPGPDITVSLSLRRRPRVSANPPRSFDYALARTHTRVALCPVSRTQLGWVSAFNPLGGAPSLSRKACIHLRPRKAVGFVSGGPRRTDRRTNERTDGWTDWQQLTTSSTNLLHLQPLAALSRVVQSRFLDSVLTSLEPLVLRQTFRCIFYSTYPSSFHLLTFVTSDVEGYH